MGLLINLDVVLLQGMESWVRPVRPFKKQSESEVPCCGDDWCLNGPPGDNCVTYFLCEICGSRAPDVATLELSPQKLKSISSKQKKAYNATSFATKVALRYSSFFRAGSTS